MRFHLFGLANIPTCKANSYEPFTGLVWNMAKMLHDHGQEVIFYGPAGSDPPCSTFVEVVPENILPDLTLNEFGVPAAAWHNDINSPTWQAFIENGRRELHDRYRTGDIALISFGRYQQFVAEAELSCEFICGYSGIFTAQKVFPSRAWQHYLYGELKQENSPGWYDAVIPHYLDLHDFPYQSTKGDYLLCLGRLNVSKGQDIAIDIANRSGCKIIVAGVDMVTHDIPPWLKNLPGDVEFVGYVDTAERLRLLQGAKALLHPCRYIEPFGLVLIEALACGTPVIGSPFGALPEIIQEGVTGYICHDMEEFLHVVREVPNLNPRDCRMAAEANHGLEVAYHRYMTYFRRLQKRLGAGWYETGTWRGPAVAMRCQGSQWGLEVGVDRGKLSGYLLREMPDLHLTMVDTWKVFPADSEYAKSGDSITDRSQSDRDADKAEALRVTRACADRRCVLQMTSEEAAEMTPNAALDFVFIDADHSYEGISKDIRLWAPKVKPGGVLCGHDYSYSPQWGVQRAVDEFATKIGKTVELKGDWTWFVQL